MAFIDKVRTNVDKTMKAMVRNARALPFPEPYWLRDPVAITSMLKQDYRSEIRGMVDVYSVGKEEIGSILCVDAHTQDQLLLGRECRGRSSSVVVKDCKPFGIAVGTLHTHPGSQPALSPGDLQVGIVGTYFGCLSWKDEFKRYWLKAVTFDTYYFMPYERQLFIDSKIEDSLRLEREMQNVVRELARTTDPTAQAELYIRQLVALDTIIEDMLGSYTVEI